MKTVQLFVGILSLSAISAYCQPESEVRASGTNTVESGTSPITTAPTTSRATAPRDANAGAGENPGIGGTSLSTLPIDQKAVQNPAGEASAAASGREAVGTQQAGVTAIGAGSEVTVSGASSEVSPSPSPSPSPSISPTQSGTGGAWQSGTNPGQPGTGTVSSGVGESR